MLSGLPQQNENSMPRMQNPGINGGAKNDYLAERKYMREKIWEFLMKRSQQPHEVPPQKMIDIVKRFEAALLKNATSMDEYMNLATLESRLVLIRRGMHMRNHNQQFSQASSSPTIATMIPTPGLQQTANSSLTATSSMDNSFPVVKSGIFMSNGNGSPTESFAGGFQHSSSALSVNSGGAQKMTSQMIPTPGFNNSSHNVVNIQSLVSSASTKSVGGFSAVKSSVASQPMLQKQQVQCQNSHNIGGHMGGGIRSTLQQNSYGVSSGPLNEGLGMMGNNISMMSGPEANDFYFSGGDNTRLIQQHFNQNQQPLYHGDENGAADKSENMRVPGISTGSVVNKDLNSMYMQSVAKASTPLMMSNHLNVNSIQQMKNLNHMDEKMIFRSQHSVNDHFENHQVQQNQQPSHHQFQHQLTDSQFSLKNDNFGQSQISHNTMSYPRPGHPTEHHYKVNDPFQFSDMPNQFQQNSIEDRSRATQFIDHPLDASSSMRQTSDLMEEQMLYSQLPVVNQQNDFGIQEDVMVHDHQYSRLQETSHGSRLPLDQGVQDQHNQKPIEQSESQLNSLCVKESIIVQTGESKPGGHPSGSNAYAQLHNAERDRERQYRNQQRWLLFLRHARRCQAPEGKCQEPRCFSVQRLLKHMENCKLPECPQPRCHQTRVLIDHHRNCRDIKCPVCIPVKNYLRRQLKAVACSDLSPGFPSSAKASCTSYDTANLTGKLTPKANPVIAETLEDLQPSVKRVKIEQSLQSVASKCETSVPLVCPPNNDQIPKKAEVAEIKVEDSGHVGQPISDAIEVIKDNLGKPDVNVPEKNYAASEDLAGFVVQDTIGSEREMVQAKTEKASEPQEVGSKSAKPKIMGVSLTELFTPEQIRQHLTGLRQWVGQRKAKAEKNQAREHMMSENTCQLCAAENLTFEPPPIYCSPCGARIKKNGGYHTVGGTDTHHYVCKKCYSEARGVTILIDGVDIPKSKMEKIKNTVETNEPWVQCDKCEVWQHQICALFNSRRNEAGQAEYACPKCYIKEVERGERMPLPQSAVLGAKDLPRSILSDHVEQRLFAKLRHERQERARLQGKSYDEVAGAESLVVRVVSSVDKKLEVKPRFLESLQVENYPTEFPYKSKVILLFQNIEGVEVCLFGMYVQEFGSECQQPNHRRVYLSYLDSVKYFRPDIKTVTGEALRTFVYHEILIGYLEYCKMRGFTSCYIWACPPLKGEDYILYCHPEIQKTPKSDKLREWYLSMLRKASREKIVVNLTNLYDQFFISMGERKAKVTAARLPYFDGDYWPGAAEDMIDKLEQEEDGSKQHKNGTNKRTITKRALKASGQIDLSGNVTKDMLLMHKLGQTISPMKEDFIMVHLQHSCTHCCVLMVSGNRWVCKQCKDFQLCDKCYDAEQKREDRERHPIHQKDKHTLNPIEITDVPEDTRDKDEIIESEFFDTRHAFLSLCQGNHYQYDTLRRAKHSSMMVLYHLHNPTCPAFVTTCAACRLDIELGQGWRCETCPEYDVCNTCYLKDGGSGHPHKLTMNPSSNAQNVEARQLRVQQLRKVLDLLVHAQQCRSLQCQYPNCRKVKGLFHHGMNCKIRITGDCALCKRMWHLLHLHARACKEPQCGVPRCRDLREHMRRAQQQSESRRRAAFNEMMRLRASELQVAKA